MTVLVVRPAPECDALVKQLIEAGVKALPAPLLSFQPGDDLPALNQALQSLKKNSIVIAVSPRAVSYSCQYLDTNGKRWPNTLTYLAVGQKTADSWMAHCGIKAVKPDKEDSEGLLSLNLLKKPAGKEVIILRGDNGRELLSQTLTQRGANVCYLSAYRRNWSDEQLLASVEHWRRESVDTLVVSSGEQLELLFQGVSDKHRHWLMLCHILVPSQRICNLAIEIGFSKVSCADGASNTHFFNALVNTNNPGKSDDRQ